MNIVISGANGFVGTELIKKIISHNDSVLAIDVSFQNSNLPDSNLIEKIEINADNIDNLQQRIEKNKYEVFCNLAWRGVNGLEKTNYEIQVNNIAFALKFAELSYKIGCNKYLCSGTIAERAIDSLPFISKASGGMMYCAAKESAHILLETYCKTIGLNYVWMQFSNIFGPNNRTGNLISYTLKQLFEGAPAVFGPATQPYDFVFIDDLLEAVYRIITKETYKSFYYIGSGKPMVLSEYLTIIGELFGRKDLIRIGEREDDGVKYSFDMFDSKPLLRDVGNYLSGSFEEHINQTIRKYRGE